MAFIAEKFTWFSTAHMVMPVTMATHGAVVALHTGCYNVIDTVRQLHINLTDGLPTYIKTTTIFAILRSLASE